MLQNSHFEDDLKIQSYYSGGFPIPFHGSIMEPDWQNIRIIFGILVPNTNFFEERNYIVA